MKNPTLRGIDLVKRFGGVVALDGVNIEVPPRSVVMLIGPNGSGKTTLINVVSGYYLPDRGMVFLNGREITRLEPHERFGLGLVRTFQIPEPFKKLTVLENILLAARSHPGESAFKVIFRRSWRQYEEEIIEKAFRILELLNIDHIWDTRAYQLSGGQLKLLEIGRALMSDPMLLLMDEPVAGVNPVLAHNIMEHIVRLRDNLGISFLIVEHRLDIVLDYVDKVYAMHRGKIIAEGGPKRVIENPLVAEAYLGG